MNKNTRSSSPSNTSSFRRVTKWYYTVFCSILLTGCVGVPKDISPVKPFDIKRYMGTWYEIARLDHRFERGLSNVSAEYSLQDDGSVRVLNRGFNEANGEYSEALGRAKFARDDNEGFLKVSFFGPFYGSYVVFHLDDDYRHAYVSGNDRSYLWFLSRRPIVSDKQREDFISTASSSGFPVDELIFVDHSRAIDSDAGTPIVTSE